MADYKIAESSLPSDILCGDLTNRAAHPRRQSVMTWVRDPVQQQVPVDIATRRAESYSEPGALPDVRAGAPEEDLERRDFTVNAIAVRLGGERRGQARTVPDALSDLEEGRLRVLH